MSTRIPFLAVAVLLGGSLADARVYPTNVCVAAKQRDAGKYCGAVLAAWAKWDASRDAAARDAALRDAATRLDTKWTKAEAVARAQDVDCADTTASSADARRLVDSAAGAIVMAVNGGLDLARRADRSCGARLLGAAARKCGTLLATESVFVRTLAKDPKRRRHDAKVARASAAFDALWSRTIGRGCPTTADRADVEARVDAISADVVTNTVVSPHVPTEVTMITPTGPVRSGRKTFTAVCMNGSPYAYFVRRGSVNKLLYYYQGGGACWDNLTCSLPACDTSAGATDDPARQHAGFASATNPRNPFKDWSVVFVSYCSCDIHFGDAAQDYAGPRPTIHVEHRGYANARVVEKWAREHFVNPDEVFVTGSSAGAYGAWFNAPLHEGVWPASRFEVLADAGNGVITQDFLDHELPHWNFAANIPKGIRGLRETLTNGTGIPGYTKLIARMFPDTRWAHYATAFDGGVFGQTGFYNVMLNPTDTSKWGTWWHASCDWHGKMRQQAVDTAAAVPSNYRYYIGTGTRHTMWASDKVYTDTTGGVPTLVDWVDAMLAGTAAWTNVECANCGLTLPGDPVPDPVQAPFVQQGSSVVAECP